MKIKEIIITILLSLIFLSLIGGFIKDYLTTPEPVFYLEENCLYSFDKGILQNFSIHLKNQGEVPGLADVCISSKEFIFMSNSGDLLHQLCFGESKINPKQTELTTYYWVTAKSDENIFNSIETATIKIDVLCRQKIWSLFYRRCGESTKICNYKKEYNSLRKLS